MAVEVVNKRAGKISEVSFFRWPNSTFEAQDTRLDTYVAEAEGGGGGRREGEVKKTVACEEDKDKEKKKMWVDYRYLTYLPTVVRDNSSREQAWVGGTEGTKNGEEEKNYTTLRVSSPEVSTLS